MVVTSVEVLSMVQRLLCEQGAHALFLQPFPHPYTDVAEAQATGRSDFGMSSQRFIIDVE
jgi:hypothetical protein